MYCTSYVCQPLFLFFPELYFGKLQPLMHARYAPTPAEYADAWIQTNITCRGQNTYIHERIAWCRHHPDTLRQSRALISASRSRATVIHRHRGWLMRTNQPLSPPACAVMRLGLRTPYVRGCSSLLYRDDEVHTEHDGMPGLPPGWVDYGVLRT